MPIQIHLENCTRVGTASPAYIYTFFFRAINTRHN